jgi:hypothetical protein
MTKAFDQLASEMFRTVARFEYALKATGYHDGDGNADANWRKFAASVPNLFENPADQSLVDATRYILCHPPKKQIIASGKLGWSDVEPDSNGRVDLILLYVRRVRNNLFHGGKFAGGSLPPERDELLLRHSLKILEACRSASQKIRDAYDGD